MVYISQLLHFFCITLAALAISVPSVVPVVSQIQMCGVTASSVPNTSVENAVWVGIDSLDQTPRQAMCENEFEPFGSACNRAKKAISTSCSVRIPKPAVVWSFFVNVGPENFCLSRRDFWERFTLFGGHVLKPNDTIVYEGVSSGRRL